MPNDDLLLCVHRGGDDDTSMYWCTGRVQSDKSITWSGDTRFEVYGQGTPASAHGVSLTVCQGIVFCAWKDANSALLKFAYWCKDTQSWGAVQMAYTASDCTPALGVLGDELFCVYQGEGSTDMYFGRCSTWTHTKTMPPGLIPNWSGNVFSQANQMCAGASLTVYDNKLFCLHRGKPGEINDGIRWSRWDGTNWTIDNDYKMGSSASGPGIAAFNSQLISVFRGRRQYNNNDKYLRTMRYTWDSQGDYLKPVTDTSYESGNESDVGPTLVICDGNLYCVHPRDGDVIQWTRWRPENNTWLNDAAFPGNRSRDEVGVVAPGNAF